MDGSEDNSGNPDYSEGSHDYLEGAHDYMVGPEDYSGNYTDYLEGAILERSDSLLEERAINTCGCAPVSSSNRIVGGKEVNPKGKLPYQVYFNPCKCNSDGMCRCGMCGGTIVNKKFVITAAHCYNSMFTDLRVIVGEHNLCDGVNEGGKVVKVKKITLHPDYNSRTVDNDIAVLELAEDLTFTDKIKPACLPSSETKDYSGSASTISGWGGTIGYGRNEQQPQQPKQCTLKETIVKLIASSDPMCSKLPGLATRSVLNTSKHSPGRGVFTFTTFTFSQLQDQTVRLCKGHRHLPRRQWRSSYCAGERSGSIFIFCSPENIKHQNPSTVDRSPL